MIHIRHKRKQKKSSEDIVAHFQRRCMERLGFVIRQRDLKDAILNLSSGLVVPVWKQSNSKMHFKLSDAFLVKYGYCKGSEIDVVAVYDNLRHNFVTVLLYTKDGVALMEGQ